MRTGTVAMAVALGLAAGAGKLAYETRADKRQDERAVLDAVDRMYALISGPKGQARDWDAFRAMFVDNRAALSAFVQVKGDDGAVSAALRSMTPEDYISAAERWTRDTGFFEAGVDHRVEIYGRLAHVWSVYDARLEPDAADPFVRGINSFTLVRGDDDRWRVLNLAWEDERSAGEPPRLDRDG